MVDFVGRSRSMLDDMQQWGDYWGQQEARAQQQWTNAEARRRYDEAARYNRAGAQSDADFYAQHGDNFDNMNGTLGGLRPDNVAPATATNATGTGPMNLQPPGSGAAATAPTPAPTQGGMQGSNEPAFDATSRQELDGHSGLSAAERRAIGAYNRATRTSQTTNGRTRSGLSPQQWEAARNLLRAEGLDVYNGRIVRTHRTYSDRALRYPNLGSPSGSSAEAPIPSGSSQPVDNAGMPTMDSEGSVPLDLGPNTEDNGGRGLEPADAPTTALDPYYQGANDTSRGLRPTREMRLVETTVQDNIRRAQLAAQHGDRAGAQEAFANALQGQAAYLQAARMQLYRAASGGSLDAMGTLLEEVSGYPPGTVRVQPTNERRTRFNLQIRNDAGEWVTASEVPRTREEMLSGLQTIVDAEGAAARTEANMEYQIARMRAGADIRIAQMNNLTAQQRNAVTMAAAQLDARVKIAIEQGRAEFHTDSENGDVYISTMGPDGRNIVERITLEQQRSADTNGRRNTQVPVSTRVQRVTGTVGTN